MEKSKSIVIVSIIVILMTIVLSLAYVQKLNQINKSKTVTVNNNQQTDGINKDTIDNLFIAERENYNVVKISIFDISKNKIIISKTITLDDSLASASTNSIGSNNSVQYNPKTKDIFISTIGFSGYDGSCTNKDGTCASRIYKFNLNNDNSNILFESSKGIAHWIVNDFDNSILVSTANEKTETIRKINAKNSQITFGKDYPREENVNEAEFVVSEDGKYTFSANKESIDGKSLMEILRLRKINNSNGEISEYEIFKGEAIDFETDISPNDQYFAFYSGNQGSKLYIYDILNKKLTNIPYQGRIGNYSLIWSGDSKRILYLLENQLSYYDISKSKSFIIDGDPKNTPYVLMWNPSSDYLVYESAEGIDVWDVRNSKTIKTTVTNKSLEIQGFLFY